MRLGARRERGIHPGAISRGRRCRRPKTLVAKLVDTRNVFCRTSSAFKFTYLCPFLPFPWFQYPRCLSCFAQFARAVSEHPPAAFRVAARRVCTACTRSSIAATTRCSSSSSATIATTSLRLASCTSPTTTTTATITTRTTATFRQRVDGIATDRENQRDVEACIIVPFFWELDTELDRVWNSTTGSKDAGPLSNLCR